MTIIVYLDFGEIVSDCSVDASATGTNRRDDNCGSGKTVLGLSHLRLSYNNYQGALVRSDILQ